MDFPNDLPTFSRFRCPVCQERFWSSRLKARCSCPACGVALDSNVERAFREGVAVFGAGMLLWVFWALGQGRELWDNGSVLVFILAFYLGHFWYRLRVTISRAAA